MIFLMLICILLGYHFDVSATEKNVDGSMQEEMTISDNSIVVVIDPGHGGENAGAIYGGYVEKTLTMNTALAMKEELEKYDGVKVYLTRTDDVDMSLGERADVAKEVGADLLLCLHYNMSEYHKLFGTECWVSAFGQCYAVGKDFSEIELSLLTKEGLYDRGIKTRLNSRGTDYYGVIRSCTANNIPSVIIEHCHLDQVNDKPFIDHNTWPGKYGVLDATAVAKYYGLKSEILGVDYSNEVHEVTPIPDEKIKPDDTAPEWCKAELIEVNEETGIITGKLSAYDPDSRILYYTASFNNGKTYNEYYKYEPDENGDVYFEVQAPNKKRTRLVIAALNMYGGVAESELLYVGHLTYLDDDVIAVNGESDEAHLSIEQSQEDSEQVELQKKEQSSIAIFFVWMFVLALPITVIILAIWKKRTGRNKKKISGKELSIKKERDKMGKDDKS